MKKKTIILIAVLVVLLGGAYFFFFKSGSSKTEIQIKTVQTKKTDVSLVVTATGTVEPIEQVDVGTQVSAEVKKIYVDFNSQVTKGQLLAELDKTNLITTVEDAQASYESAIIERKYLQSVYERQKELFDNNLLSQADLDLAEYNLAKAKSQVIQALSTFNKAKTNLSYAEIYSPVDGVVLSREVDEGQTVAASYSTPTLFTIAQDLKQMQVEADVDEADIGQVKVGQRVTFTVDAYQGEEFNGKVTQVRLDPTVESNVVTYTVVIKAENPDLKLMPGLTATITIFTQEEKDVLTVEAKALNFSPNPELVQKYNQLHGGSSDQTQMTPPPAPDAEMGEPDSTSVPEPRGDDDSHRLLWVLEDSLIKPQPVTVGISDGVNVQIIKGLTENQTVVYSLIEDGVESEFDPSTDSEGGSPFMPKPPGSNKKK